MKRFHFRLESLLRLRVRHEEQLRLSLAAKQREAMDVREKINALSEELKIMQEEQRSRRSSETDVGALRHSVSYRHQLKLRMLHNADQLQERLREAEKIRSQLTQATRERRIVEIIKEKRFAEWKREYARQEQKGTDELSQVRAVRRKGAVSAP